MLVQYTQRVYAKQFAQIDVKVYDKQQNKLNDFNLNYGHVSNTYIQIIVLDEENQKFYSSNGITNERGFLQQNF